MASIYRVEKDWRCQVSKRGVRKSRVFISKQEARNWGARIEYEIENREKIVADVSLGEVFDRYARERSGQKRGARWEVVRLERLQRDPIARLPLGDLSAADFTDWRERRLREVSAATVTREMGLLSSVLSTAVREWNLLRSNPLSDVRRPPSPPPRDRLPTYPELRRMAYAAGPDLSTATARAFHAFKFAMRTAMRAGEICKIAPDHIDMRRQVVHLPTTKNGYPRDVPLSRRAIRLLQELPPADPVFGLSPRQLDSLFRKVRDRALVKGLHFHDSRAWALTVLSKRVDILALARISGHRDLKMLQIYYRETAEQLARRLD